MKKILLLLLCVPLIGLGQIYKGCPSGKENIPSTNEGLELEFLRILNNARSEIGLSILRLDKDLTRSSRYHSYDMSTENYYTHDTQDRNGDRLIVVCKTFDRVNKFSGEKYGVQAENIFKGPATAEAAYLGWCRSSGHKENMFNAQFTRIGIGFVNNHWTTNFR